MKNARNKAMTAAWVVTALTLSVSGCGQSPTSATSSGAGGSTTTTTGSGGATTGSGGDMTSSGDTTTGAGGSTTGAGGGGGAGGSIPVVPADFEGIDVTMAPSGKPPQGCVGGFDAATGALDLTLGGEVSALLLATVNGEIQANGVTCTAADTTAATTANTLTIHVTGTAADEAMILDFATGPFGSKLLTAGGGIHVDLGAGKNSFFLRGTLGADTVTAGTAAGKAIFDPTKAGSATVDVASAQVITVSLGPGNDGFQAAGVAGSAPLALSVTVFGGAGDDVLEGGAGGDKLHGGEGNDTFKTRGAADGADRYDGDAGADTMDYSNRTAALTVSIGTIADDGAAGEKDDVAAGMETLLGGSGDDKLVGSTGDESIYGNVGNDVLMGGSGSDLLDGGPGVDVLDGGGGDGDICISEPNEPIKGCEI